MYSLRLFLKSFLVFFLTSCQSNFPAQEVLTSNNVENADDTLKKSIVVGAEQLDLIK